MLFANWKAHKLAAIAGASVLEPADGEWEDVDLSPRSQKIFREIFRRANAGKRVTALFAGPLGSGKTRAASLIARDLGRKVIHVRLSALDSQPLEETEKNLVKVFSGTDPASTVLLFDEAETLFAKRSAALCGDVHYQSLEQGFLSCMDKYCGLTILATDHCKRIDPLLVHRLHFAVKI